MRRSGGSPSTCPPTRSRPIAPPLLGPRLEELCFQIAGLWEAGREGRLALPAHVDRLSVLGDVATDGRGGALVAIARPIAGVRRARFDCQVLDDDGTGAAAARGLPHRAAARSAARRRPRAAPCGAGLTAWCRPVTEIRRLGIVNRGEPAMRLLTAVAELNRAGNVHRGAGAPHHHRRVLHRPRRRRLVRAGGRRGDLPRVRRPTSTRRDGHRKSRYLDEAAVVAALVGGRVRRRLGRVGLRVRTRLVRAALRGGGHHLRRAGQRHHPGARRQGHREAAGREGGRPGSSRGAVGRSTTVDAGGRAGRAARATRSCSRRPPVAAAAASASSRTPADLATALASARSEAELAFGDPTVFLEHFVEAARHVEVQIIADYYGTIWAVGVRDCSIQRRNQKVIEESASTALDAGDRGRDQVGRRPAVRRRPATATPAPSSSSSTPRRRSSCSWRSTPGCRSSTRSPR